MSAAVFDEVPVVDEVVVERLLALRAQVARPGEDVLGDLLALFVRDTKIRLAAIREATDADARRQAAHALKGSAGNVGARRVAAMAAHVEKHAETAGDVERLEREVEAAVRALTERLR